MARIRNRRAARTSNSGASWISYSDMMAALLLVFVLILSVSLYQYFTMLETKTAELDAQKALVSQQQVTLDAQTLQLASQQVTMDKQATEIAIIQVQLDSQAKELENAYIVLSDQQAQLQQAQTDLADREAKLIILQTDLNNKEMALQAANEVLENQQAAMAAQAEQIDALIGIRPRIITALSSALSSANLSATVDNSTGDIVLDSSVLFCVFQHLRHIVRHLDLHALHDLPAAPVNGHDLEILLVLSAPMQQNGFLHSKSLLSSPGGGPRPASGLCQLALSSPE